MKKIDDIIHKTIRIMETGQRDVLISPNTPITKPRI